MIDYPIGTTIELQLVGGYGSQRVVALSHPHCLIVNGFDNYTRLVLNESNNYFEQYRPELTSFSPQFSEEVINSLYHKGFS